MFCRTPAPAVAPPTVPGQYAAMQQQRVSGYAPGMPPPLGMTQMQQNPGSMNQTPVGMARPISQSSVQSSAPPSPGIMIGMPDGGPPRFRASHMPHQTSLGNLSTQVVVSVIFFYVTLFKLCFWGYTLIMLCVHLLCFGPCRDGVGGAVLISISYWLFLFVV